MAVATAPALAWDADDLAALSAASPADLKAAAALWRREAPAWARDLLQAEPDDGDPTTTAPLVLWLAALGRYQRAGRTLSPALVRQAVDTVLQASTDRLKALTGRVVAGALDVPTWQLSMAQEVEALHLSMGAVAHGGLAQLAPADLALLEGRTAQQLEFLGGFAADLARGRLTGPQAVARAALYGQAGRSTYEAVYRRDQGRRGLTEERRVLHAAESCEECEAAAGEWAEIGTLPEIGTLLCQVNCKCTLEYR